MPTKEVRQDREARKRKYHSCRHFFASPSRSCERVKTVQLSLHHAYCLVCKAFYEHWPTTAIRKEFGSLEVGEESAICFDGAF